MSKIFVSKISQRNIDQAKDNAAHSLMLIGANGLYKYEIARQIVTDLLEIPEEKLTDNQYFLSISPVGTTISIDQVRHLQNFLKLKTIGDKAFRRAVIIKNAHWLTIEAQNALLKILEEPPTDTIIILTLNGNRSLKPTLYSRSQIVYLKKPSKEETVTFYSEKDQKTIESIYFMSGGAPKTIADQLDNAEKSPEKEYIDQAKQFLSGGLSYRLSSIKDLTKEKIRVEILLENLLLIASFSLKQSAEKGDLIGLQRWTGITDQVYHTKQGVLANGNVKLLLTNLSLNL